MITGPIRLARGDSTLEPTSWAAEEGGPPQRSILMVAPSWPFPATWGFAVRVYHLARHLAARHRVTLLTYAGGNATGEDLRAASWFHESHFVPARPPRFKRGAQLASLFSVSSYHMSHLTSTAMRRALARCLSDGGYDLVQVESSQLAAMLPSIDVPIVLDEHNIEFALLSRIARNERSAARKWYTALEAAKARREEVRAWAMATGVVFTSGADLSVMHRLDPAKRGKVVGNGVDLEEFSPQSDDPDHDMIVFTGSINYRPNTDAVDYFNRHVFPAILRLRPSARFVVVGQGAPDWLVRSAPRGVEFTGYVPDVRPYLARAAVVVAPLRSGGGTRLKILEALAMAKPLVTTTIGCEGLNVADGEQVRIADAPDAMAEAVAATMSDPARAAEMGRNGRRLVERDYGWNAAGRRLEQFHTQLIGKETRV